MRSSDDHAGDRAGTKRRYTVAEAAGVLGLSAEAVRSRLARGTLEGTKENGTVYAVLETAQAHDRAHPNGAPTHDRTHPNGAPTHDQTALVDALRDQVEDLRRRLDSSEEANRENRRIIAALTQRIPELEPPREPRESPETIAAEPEGAKNPRPATVGAQEGLQRRSWWREFFGFE